MRPRVGLDAVEKWRTLCICSYHVGVKHFHHKTHTKQVESSSNTSGSSLSWFSIVLPENTWIVPEIRPRVLSLTFFSVLYLLSFFDGEDVTVLSVS